MGAAIFQTKSDEAIARSKLSEKLIPSLYFTDCTFTGNSV